MADVSHEIDSLRFVVDSPLSSKVAMFNNQVHQRQQAQLLNPFSSGTDGRSSPKPTFSKEEYGKPLAGSLTEMRGQKANMHVFREMLELCQIIDTEGYKVNDEPSMRVIPFGELFNIYNYISDKVVGILLRARKYKYVQFEGEMLFQRRDDDVPIFLLRPIKDIREEVNSKIEEIKRASSPAPPQATTLLLDKGAHEQKLQEASLSTGGRRTVKSRSASPAAPRPPTGSRPGSKAATPTLEEMNSKLSNGPMPISDAAGISTANALSNPIINLAGLKMADIKTDMNRTGSNCNITINDLPSIIIQNSAANVSGKEGPTSQTIANTVQGGAAVTLGPTNFT